jgi:ESCRT-II complex subunit VPS25
MDDVQKLRSFPPLYTKQRNAETERQRLDDWVRVVVAWAVEMKQSEVLVQKELAQGELFRNDKIDRRVALEDAVAILDHVATRGNGEWAGNDKSRFLVLTKSLAEWGQLVLNYVDHTGQMGSVLTVFELLQGDDTTHEPFFGMDSTLFMRVLAALEANHQAKVFTASDPAKAGVKFLKPQ